MSVFRRRHTVKFCLSADGSTWSEAYYPDNCSVNLSNGLCAAAIDSTEQARYVKVVVQSSCAGCNNEDWVSGLDILSSV